jgi:hypothetical protein
MGRAGMPPTPDLGAAVSRRGLPPTDEPRIAVTVQHVASRAHLLPRLASLLGCTLRQAPEAGIFDGTYFHPIDPWVSVALVTGDPAKRDPWATYQSCLGMTRLSCAFGGCDDPDCDDPRATHLLVIQDDALPVPHLYSRLAPLVAERPGDLLCLYVPERPTYMGRAMQIAHAKQERFAPIPGGMFVPLVAAVWPVWLAEECLEWVDRTPTTRTRRCDDAQVARFLSRKRYQPYGVVPSLVEHDESTPSTLGLGRYPRHAAIMAE